MTRLLCTILAAAALAASGYADDKPVELRLLDKFPDDYLDKTVQTTAYFYSDFLRKSEELPGQYTVAINDRPKGLPSYGTEVGLIRSRMNYVVTKDQAKKLAEEIDRDAPGKRTVTIKIGKETVNGTTYYVGRIVEITK